MGLAEVKGVLAKEHRSTASLLVAVATSVVGVIYATTWFQETVDARASAVYAVRLQPMVARLETTEAKVTKVETSMQDIASNINLLQKDFALLQRDISYLAEDIRARRTGSPRRPGREE